MSMPRYVVRNIVKQEDVGNLGKNFFPQRNLGSDANAVKGRSKFLKCLLTSYIDGPLTVDAVVVVGIRRILRSSINTIFAPVPPEAAGF